ncbi:hypothetical protein HD806DRAFT_535218 [Xylariaceae sp. AK1471]|nr:hypothetical protein HD806DRAFT_535218 [Xylariaceae sp. AK1471]
MWSSPTANTFIRSYACRASRNGLAPTRVSQPLRRTYASERPPLPQDGNNNRPLVIAALVGVSALAYFLIPQRDGKPVAQPGTEVHSTNFGQAKYEHPEHKNP